MSAQTKLKVQFQFRTKAQVAIEYILLIGLIVAVIIPIFYYSLSTITQNIKMNRAYAMVNKIVETADMLYALGPGSQEVIVIEIPGGVKNITIQGKEINARLMIFSNVSDINAISKANMSGTLVTKAGSWHILMKNEDNTIKISSKY